MRGCARFLAAIALILFVVSATLAVFFVTIRLHLLSPQTYTDALREEAVYEDLPFLVASQLRYGMTFNPCLEDPDLCEETGEEVESEEASGVPPSYLANLPAEIWEEVISLVIDPGWLESQMEAVLDQVFSILTGDQPGDAIVISFAELKARISGEAGYQAVMQVMRAQPDCTIDQLAEINQAFDADDLGDAVIRCSPPDEIVALIDPYIKSGLSDAVEGLPEKVEFKIPEEFADSEGRFATGLSVIRAVFRFTPWIALFWLLAVTVLAVRELRSWFGWWGVAFFFTGLSVILTGFIFGPLLNWGMDRALGSRNVSGFSPELFDVGLRVANNIIGSYSARLLIFGGIMLGLGLLLLILRMFTRPPAHKHIGPALTQPRSDI